MCRVPHSRVKILKNNCSHFILKETAKLLLTPHHGKVILDIFFAALMLEGSIYYGDKCNYYDGYREMTQDQARIVVLLTVLLTVAWSLFKLGFNMRLVFPVHKESNNVCYYVLNSQTHLRSNTCSPI